MRSVRLSKTFLEAFDMLLAQGEERFGALVIAEKRAAVKDTIENFLARHPSAKRPHRRLRLHVYPITDTPFMVLYDFDDAELRVHFIFHRKTDLRTVDPRAVEW